MVEQLERVYLGAAAFGAAILLAAPGSAAPLCAERGALLAVHWSALAEL